MQWTLPFGENASLELALRDDAQVLQCGAAPSQPLDDPSAAVSAALSDPLDLPPVYRAIAPGDRVVVAIDRDVPQLPEVVAGAVSALLEGAIEPSDISLVLASSDDLSEGRHPRSLLPRSVQELVAVTAHAADDPAELSYLAATEEEAFPIYLNRRIIDADFVLPISCLRLDDALGYVGVCGGLFPAFADAKTQERFNSPGAAEGASPKSRRRRESEEAAWLLGIQFMLQVTPGPRHSLLNVLCGSPSAVAQRGKQLCEAAWRQPIPNRASLVVAAIDGGPDEQNWQNVGRALLAASRAVADGGAIVLCTQLRQSPGPALRILSNQEDLRAAHRQIHRLHTPDALSASLFAKVMERCRVYLFSELQNDEVEDLGLAPVESAAEISRLGRMHQTCLLLSSAQYAMPAAGG
jgi:nickel-dependent lactate racemase